MRKDHRAQLSKGTRGANVTEVFNRQSEKSARQLLRNILPAAELILWSKLKSRQVCGRGSYNFDSNYGTRTTNHRAYDS